jgi:hypothetical protein
MNLPMNKNYQVCDLAWSVSCCWGSHDVENPRFGAPSKKERAYLLWLSHSHISSGNLAVLSDSPFGTQAVATGLGVTLD